MQLNHIHCGDAAQLIGLLAPDSIQLMVTSPPYHVGKSYEQDSDLASWQRLLRTVLAGTARALIPGGFAAVNINDILCFPDPQLPRINAINHRMLRGPSHQDVHDAAAAHPLATRRQLATLLGTSEQTVHRRLEHNNVRGGKKTVQTRIFPVVGMLTELAAQAGLSLYDRRIWSKGPGWTSSPWHATSYRAVDDFEHILIFWKPGPTRLDRGRLTKQEWVAWGSRGVWEIPSVPANDVHEAMFPRELPSRLIRLLSDPGDIVLDPFIGSGTTAAAAMRAGRHWLGFDRDETAVDRARAALSAAESSIA